jgi:hypothetical protein
MFGQFNPYYLKAAVHGRLAVVLDGVFDDRGLQLIKPTSRALKAYEIHELILTDEQISPGGTVNRIAYVGFVEITRGGVIVVGDPVYVNDRKIGLIAGFDETHMPNHLNIVLTGSRETGKTLDLSLGAELKIG